MSTQAARSCDDVRLLISAEIDGAATAEERRAVAEHVAACPGCARARADYLAIEAALAPVTAGSGLGARPGPDLWKGIERHITAGVPGAGAALFRGRAVRAAAIGAAIGLSFALGRLTAGPGAAPVEVVSKEAEAAAVVAVVDAFFGPEADLNARVKAAGRAQPISLESDGSTRAKGSY